jgi:hypothetical protein
LYKPVHGRNAIEVNKTKDFCSFRKGQQIARMLGCIRSNIILYNFASNKRQQKAYANATKNFSFCSSYAHRVRCVHTGTQIYKINELSLEQVKQAWTNWQPRQQNAVEYQQEVLQNLYKAPLPG